MPALEDAFGNDLVIMLAGEPVAKGRPRFGKNGVTYTPVKTQRYEGSLAWAAQVAMNGRTPFETALHVRIFVYKGVPDSWSSKKKSAALLGVIRPTGKPDVDNYAKCMDALNKIVWTDDSLIVDLTVRKCYSERPRLEIHVRTLDGA
jgi:Holliday junction resolvase RusA-like endonuclease